MRVYKLDEPRGHLTYSIATHITQHFESVEGEWFVHVDYLTEEELPVRRVIYGPCETLIMAVLCEDELRVVHKQAMASLFEQLHNIST